MAESDQAPYVIVVYHQKGGVGKTTTAINLGVCFAEQGQTTLLVDLDASANLTSGVGLNPAKVRYSTAGALLGNQPLVKIIQPVGIVGLDIAPANTNMLIASHNLTLLKRYEFLLRDSLNVLNEMQQERSQSGKFYQWVVVDCPPSGGALVIPALVAANLALVPIECEYYSLSALDSVFTLLSEIKQKFNPDLKLRMVVTRFDHRGRLHSKVLEKLHQYYQRFLFETVIGVDTKVKYSQMAGQPLGSFAPRSRALAQYRMLTQEIIAYAMGSSV